MIVKLLTEHHLEFLSLKGGCTGPSGSTLVKMSNCWKSGLRLLYWLIYRTNTLLTCDCYNCYFQVFAGFFVNIVCVLVLMGATETIGQGLFNFHTMPEAFLANMTII